MTTGHKQQAETRVAQLWAGGGGGGVKGLKASVGRSAGRSRAKPGLRVHGSRRYLGLGGEEGPGEAVHVAQVHLNAGVGEAQLVEAGGVVPGADVALAAEGGDGDGVLQLRLRQVVADASVHVTLRRQEARFITSRWDVFLLPLPRQMMQRSGFKALHSDTGGINWLTEYRPADRGQQHLM